MDTPTIYLLFLKNEPTSRSSIWGLSSPSISFGPDGTFSISNNEEPASTPPKTTPHPLDGYILMQASASLNDLVASIKSSPTKQFKIVPVTTILDVQPNYSISIGGVSPEALVKEFGQ